MRRIKVYGTDWCRSTFGVREYLMNARLDYDFFDIERDPSADAFVHAAGKGARRYPVIVFSDQIVTNPSVAELGRLLRAYRVEPIPRVRSQSGARPADSTVSRRHRGVDG
jgi:mycoredoxin